MAPSVRLVRSLLQQVGEPLTSRIGLGVCTFNRPTFAEKCIKSIVRVCAPVTDSIVVYDDGSDPKYRGGYKRAWAPLATVGGVVLDDNVNHGVAYAKNRLIEHLIADGCDWILISEDDLKVTDARAITEYVRICEDNGLHHLSFAHHGPANVPGPVEVSGDVSYFFHSIGAWTIFSRECLEKVGLFQEALVCAWEHVEHTMRLIQAGYMPNAAAHRYPDATHSAQWITEQPNAIEKSSIRPRPDWQSNIRNGLLWWRDNEQETYEMLFGPQMPLHQYALSITQ